MSTRLKRSHTHNSSRLVMVVSLLLVVQSFTLYGATSGQTDRWFEFDLDWFERSDMEGSVTRFWDRYHPLVQVDGYKGVILNVGWLSQFIFQWQGDLDAPITFPKHMRVPSWFKDEGQFSGNTIERRKLWKHRFDNASPRGVVEYENWTYGDLKHLMTLIRDIARKNHGVKDLKVGAMLFAGRSIYGGDTMAFAAKHPNAFLGNGYTNLTARLAADTEKYAAFPQGIPEGTPLTEFFGKQWGSLSKAVGLEAIVLRDGYMGPRVYSRGGIYGKLAPPDPQKVEEWSRATADLVKQTKISNPDALVMGYSNAASAVGDWRGNCFDLEGIAKEGYLDVWIDQTWAGAWNEVGQRKSNFWNNQNLGWTYQLGYVLGHAAVLADTNVRHYVLTEAFDGWENWDVIHNARERLRWGIWAYSHAAVIRPDGLKMPAGNYISWSHQGQRLLSQEDIEFLTETSNAAFRDARATARVYGPTLVYCRSAMEWQSHNRPDANIGEWIDEQAGSLMKWSVPILSITRSEYLPQVESDFFIFQTPVHLKEKEKANILKVLQSGKPTAVFASPAGGIDPDIANVLGISSTQERVGDLQYIGTLNGQTEGIFEGLPNTFPIFQPFSKNRCRANIDVIYYVKKSPCLIFNNQGGNQLITWDPPEFRSHHDGGARSLDEMLGSPTPYALTARLFNDVMKKNGLISVDEVRQYQPVNVTSWQIDDGAIRVLAGNLEEGINHTANHSVETTLNLPDTSTRSRPIEVSELWNGTRTIVGDNKLVIYLGQAETRLYTFDVSK